MATPLGRQGNRSYYLEDEKIQKKKEEIYSEEIKK
jgi:hypothetical protein